MRSFRTQVALLSGVTAIAATMLITVITTRALSAHVAKDQGEALHALAHSTSVLLGEGLHERLREIELLASSFSVSGVAADAQRVRIATKGMLSGKDVSARPWFQHALKGPHVGDVHEAKLLAKMLPESETGEPLRFVDFAAPVIGPDGRVAGVLGAHANWDWIREVVRSLRSDRARNEGVLIFILDKDGQVIHRPSGPQGLIEPVKNAPWPTEHGIVAWSDSQRYLSATSRLNHKDARTQLGWRIVVRQPEALALVAATDVRNKMLMLGGIASLLAMSLAWVAAGRVSKPLRRLTRAASLIREGQLDARMPPLAGSRELQDLSESLRGMTQSLQQGQADLAQANATLEEKVRERTQALAQANEELANLARKDGLTGLYNRRAAEGRMDEECARHRRNGKVFSLLVLDIDHFKRINDTFGHAAGDEALKRVAHSLAAHCRVTDFIARIGGEEFMVLLPETELTGAMQLGEKLRGAIAALDIPEVGHATISIGVAQSHLDDSQPIRTVLKAADDALYAAKAGGRNRVVASSAEMAQA
jgi:diguanylate cyclase